MHPSELTLNEFVEGGLDAAERGTVEAHLRECDVCRTDVEELRGLQAAVASLTPLEPPANGWRRIERAISHQSPVTSPQSPVTRQSPSSGRLATGDWRLGTTAWLALAATLMLATAIGLRYTIWREPDQAPASATEELPSAQAIEAELLQAEEHYQKAISGLEKIANAEKGSLDPKTAATLQSNLAVVDQAISESRAALRTQPGSEWDPLESTCRHASLSIL